MPELTSPHPIGEHAPQQSDLPAPPRAHALTLENRARLTVTGVTRIVSCDELGATLQTPLGDLTIGGQGMQVSELSVRTGKCISPARSNICSIPRTSRAKNRAVGCWPACCVDGAIAAVVGSAGRCAALSWGGPAAWRCTGWGGPCLWQRPGALLCVGCAGLCCCSLCLLRLRGGGFGYRGGALVYGRRHGAGGTVLAVVRFPRGAQGAARHGVCSGLAAALCGGLCGTPVQTAAAGPDQKDSARPGGATHKIHARKAEKSRKMCCKTSTQYYIIKLYLSMPA